MFHRVPNFNFHLRPRLSGTGALLLGSGASLLIALQLACAGSTKTEERFTEQTASTTICTWKDNKACAYTPTYDDGNIKSLRIWDKLHEQYGIVGTMALIPSWIDDEAVSTVGDSKNHDDPVSLDQSVRTGGPASHVWTSIGAWDEYKTLANNGRWEVASHTQYHVPVSYFGSSYLHDLGITTSTDRASGITELDSILQSSRDELQTKLGVKVDALVYPYFDYGQAPAIYSDAAWDPIVNVIAPAVVLTEAQKFYLTARAGDEAARFPVWSVNNNRIVPKPNGSIIGINDPNSTNYLCMDTRIEGCQPSWWWASYEEMTGMGFNADPAVWAPTGVASTSPSWIEQAIQWGGYLTVTFHGVSTDKDGKQVEDSTVYQACPEFWYEDHFKHVQANKDKVWNDTMANVHKYMRERRWAETGFVSSTPTQAVLSLTYNPEVKIQKDSNDNALVTYMDPAVYNFPLTLRTEVIGSWKKATITQGSKTITKDVLKDANGRYILFDAIPEGGNITIDFAN